MLTVNSANSIIMISLLLFAYIFSITFAGSMQALTAYWVADDDTAANAGFADFNPFKHLGFIDFIFFYFIRFMLGNPIPLDVRQFKTQWHGVVLTIVCLSRAVVHILFALGASLGVMLAFRQGNAFGAMQIVEELSTKTAGASSSTYVLGMFAVSMTYVNIVLAGISLVRDAVYSFVLYKFAKDEKFIEYAGPIMMFGVLLLFIIFGDTVIMMTQLLVSKGAELIASLVGIGR